MLALDSLVIDLIFKANAAFSPEDLLASLGGDEVVRDRKILDPDMQDPRFELELSPSMPFRRQGERRLMIMDDSVAPMRKDPRTDPVVPIDLRSEKARLIAACEAVPVRLGRINALGSWGDAVLVARDARDLRGVCLIPWALDPTVDVSGKRRASRLSQAEFEEKLLAFDKRLEELDEQEILANLGPVNFERKGELLIVDVLENDGTWDLRKSLGMEASLAALDRFSLLPGAPAEKRSSAGGNAKPAPAAKPAEKPKPVEPPPPPRGTGLPPLGVADVGEQIVLIFPRERFDLDVAAALGKRDWDAVLLPQDPLNGSARDRMFKNGAGFVAPLEFLSEVFLEGKPLTRGEFDQHAQPLGSGGARSLEVHFPRFGPVTLIDVTGRGRFITSERSTPESMLALL